MILPILALLDVGDTREYAEVHTVETHPRHTQRCLVFDLEDPSCVWPICSPDFDISQEVVIELLN